jgi:hypothetical protein
MARQLTHDVRVVSYHPAASCTTAALALPALTVVLAAVAAFAG